jgi:hypothetical protein
MDSFQPRFPVSNPPPIPTRQCGESSTVRGEFLVLLEGGGGLRVFSRAAHGVYGRYGRHVIPSWGAAEIPDSRWRLRA